MTLAIWLLSFSLTATPATPAALVVPVAPGAAPLAAATYTGFWLMEDQDAVLEISRQGEAYVGRFVAFRKSAADPKKKALLNTQLLKDLQPDGDGLAYYFILNPLFKAF